MILYDLDILELQHFSDAKHDEHHRSVQLSELSLAAGKATQTPWKTKPMVSAEDVPLDQSNP